MFPETKEGILQLVREEITQKREPLPLETIHALAEITDDELDFMKSGFNQDKSKERVIEILSEGHVSVPQAISRYIAEGSRLFQEIAWVDLGGGKQSFLFWHDFTKGMLHVPIIIDIAEGEMAGKTDEKIMGALERVNAEGGEFSQGETEFFLNMRSGVKRWTRLLIEDPSGFQLIDEYIAYAEEEFKKPPGSRSHFIPDFYTPDFFLMGAGFARDLYHSAYDAVKE